MSNDKKLYCVSPYLFFLIKDSKIIAWDYKHHQQYEIEKHHFNRLLQLSSVSHMHCLEEYDDELFSAGFLLEYDAQLDWHWDILSQIFHFGTCITETENSDQAQDPHLFIDEYISYCNNQFSNESLNYISNRPSLEKIILPSPDIDFLSKIDFLAVLKSRKTCRSFIGSEAVSLDDLSSLLYVSFGDFHSSGSDYETYGYQKVGMRKTSPSGGGLHPTEAYLVINKVIGLKSGVYYYSPAEHALFFLSVGNVYDRLTEMLCGQFFYENTSFGIFLTSRFDKLWNKYPHSRAYRVALMDIGHISQTFQLVATAMGMKTWLSGAFQDEDVRTLLKITPASEQPFLFLTCGASHDASALDVVVRSKNIS